MMINFKVKTKVCDYCKNKDKIFELNIGKKNVYLCDKCLHVLYSELGTKLVPKSPTSILKKDNRIKDERF